MAHARARREPRARGAITVDVNDVVVPRPDGGRRVFARRDALVRARDRRARRARPHDRRRAHRAAREVEPRHLLRARERRQRDHRARAGSTRSSTACLKALTAGSEQALKVTRRAPRQVRMFSTPVQVAISRDGNERSHDRRARRRRPPRPAVPDRQDFRPGARRAAERQDLDRRRARRGRVLRHERRTPAARRRELRAARQGAARRPRRRAQLTHPRNRP